MEKIIPLKVLVTGGTGFIGSALLQYLDQSNISKRALTRPENLETIQLLYPDVEFVLGDLMNSPSLISACAGNDVVIHLAGIAHVGKSENEEARRVIVEGTRNLLHAAIDQKVKRFIYLSSTLAQVADAVEADTTIYGKLRREAEELLLKANAENLIEVVILRPVNVYGVGMKGNIATMISLIARGRFPPLPKTPAKISLVSSNDLAQAIYLAINSTAAAGRIFTITDGIEYKISEVEKAIYLALGKKIPRWHTPRMLLFAAALMAGIFSILTRSRSAIGLRTYRNVMTDNLFDNELAVAELGFKPTSDFYQLLPKIIEKISQKNLTTNSETEQ